MNEGGDKVHNPRYFLDVKEFYGLLVDHRMNIKQFSEKTGINRSTIWRITLPKDHPKVSSLSSITIKKIKESFSLSDEKLKKLIILL